MSAADVIFVCFCQIEFGKGQTREVCLGQNAALSVREFFFENKISFEGVLSCSSDWKLESGFLFDLFD